MKSFGILQILCCLLWFLPESRVTGQGNWTWLGGSNTINQLGIYGAQGIADVNNRPGARSAHSMVMHPAGQSIFLFGGSGYTTTTPLGWLNDMWMFNVTSGWWTWMGGSNIRDQVGVYGTQGVASMNSRPGTRQAHSMVMHPTGQLIFVFGGSGYDDTGSILGLLNDMWMLNVTSGWWTWLSGSNTIDQKGIYGTQGVASVNNRPGAQDRHFMVIHPSGQLIFIFGWLNDMWMFNVTSGWWTWLSGSKLINQLGVYGTQGVASTNNRPGARHFHSMAMHPTGQSIFIFGGIGYQASLPESQSHGTKLTGTASILSHGSSSHTSTSLTNINLPSSTSVSILSHSSRPLISPTLTNINYSSSANATIPIDGSRTLITQTLTNINLPSSSSMQVSPPTQNPIITVRLKWWLTIGPVYGFLIIFFAAWILFMIGLLAGYMYDERQNHAANRQDTDSSSTPADSSSFTDSSFPSSSTKPTSSYGLPKSSDFTTTSSYTPTLVASTNQGTSSHSANNATSSHRYYPNTTTTTNTAVLGDPPTLVAPSTKENSSFTQWNAF